MATERYRTYKRLIFLPDAFADTYGMDPIKPLSALNALLGQRIASRRSEQFGVTGKSTQTVAADTAAAGGMAAAITLEELRRRIGEAVQSIDPADPDRRRKTARVFAENVLRWQFGDDILNDPCFAELLDEVGAVLEIEGDGLIHALQEVGRNT